MRILYVAARYVDGKSTHGHSFEHWNFYDTLVRMGHDILYFDFLTLSQQHGRAWVNRRLLDVARTAKADLLFCVLFGDELDPAVMRTISEKTDTMTLNWFCDDHFRFENFSRRWAPSFNYVVTTARSAVPKYKAIGYEHVIKSQWGCNHRFYRKLNLPPAYDVTFVGAAHGSRRAVIESLRRAGIDVRTWGIGWESWESGRIDQEEMIRVINQSRIALNLSNAPAARTDLRSLFQTAAGVGRSLGRGLLGQGWPQMSRTQRGRWRRPSFAQFARYSDQIKGRNFEVPGCGTFLLTGNADELERYYKSGREVAVFTNADDLVDKIRYYLKQEDERRAVAAAGYNRTLREHTYDHRFAEIFQCIGLGELARSASGMGTVEEVGVPPGLPGTRSVSAGSKAQMPSYWAGGATEIRRDHGT